MLTDVLHMLSRMHLPLGHLLIDPWSIEHPPTSEGKDTGTDGRMDRDVFEQP